MFQVRLFGYFNMTKDDKTINEASLHSPQLLKLLVYLVLYRNRPVTSQELEQYLWDADSGKQTDALKNLVCRLRKVLSDTFGKEDYVITGRGNYQWNTALQVEIDAEKFEEEFIKYMKIATESEDVNEEAVWNQLQGIRGNAIRMYKGIFLKNYEADFWTSMGLKYQSMYLRLVGDLREYLEKNENYGEIEKLCSRVLDTDPYDEEWNRCLVRVLLIQNKSSHAEKYYKGLEKNLQSKNVSQKQNLLRALKEELKQTNNNNKQITLENFVKDIYESENKKNTAFKVEYEEFKALATLQNRKDARHNTASYTLLLTVLIDSKSLEHAAEVSDFLINMAMEEIESLIEMKLRNCDVICKCSNTQFIVLLDDCSYENSIKVAKRISELFANQKTSRITKLKLDIHKIVT